MPRCPKCGKEISSLDLDVTVRADVGRSYNVSYNPVKNSLDRTDNEVEDVIDVRDTLSESYCCPECSNEVAETYDEALEFFKGGE